MLTAIEDFLADREELRFALVPAFFGLGVIWARESTVRDALEAILDPWDRNPLLERLEANRVLHLAAWQREAGRAAAWCQEQERAQGRAAAQAARVAARSRSPLRLSRLRQRGEPAFSKDEIRELLPEHDRDV